MAKLILVIRKRLALFTTTTTVLPQQIDAAQVPTVFHLRQGANWNHSTYLACQLA
jgi:hypothetical protein